MSLSGLHILTSFLLMQSEVDGSLWNTSLPMNYHVHSSKDYQKLYSYKVGMILRVQFYAGCFFDILG